MTAEVPKDDFEGIEKIPLKGGGSLQMKPVDDVHNLHITIRTANKFRPIKGFDLNIKKTETEVSLKDAVKFKIITGGAMGPVDEKIFNSFLSCLQGKSDISEEAADLVRKFDKRYDLLIVDKRTKKAINN